MANGDYPRGARPTGVLYPPHPYTHPASDGSAIYPGDFVKTSGGYITVGAATNRLRGVAANYVAASTAGTVYVYDDPRQKFIIQDDAGATLSQAEVGENCDILATAGDSTLKVSQMEIAAAGHATTTAQLHILEVANVTYPDGTINAAGVNCDWVVLINEHELGPAENVGT